MTPGNTSAASATSGMRPRVTDRVSMPFKPGEIVGGKYEIIELIGEGGVGFVVAANHVELGDKVALKFLRPEMLENTEIVGRFAREATAAVKIKSEHVARVFDVGQLHDGSPFIVMEFLDGRDLYNVIIHDGPQPIRCAVDYVLQACEALADAHLCGIVHRDIKPENLFLIQRSHGIDLIKVLDFGISKVALTGSAIETQGPLIRTMLPMGSPVYMSPEQIRASKNVDSRTDIWSMGCVLHELLTGIAAFDAPTLTQLSATILENDPVPPSQGNSGIPAALDAVVARCLEKDPNRRFQNVAELALALYPFAASRSRISVERCCLLLDVSRISDTDLELANVRTPSCNDSDSAALFPDERFTTTSVSESVANVKITTFKSVYRSKRNVVLVSTAFVVVAIVLFWLRTLHSPANAASAKTPFGGIAAALFGSRTAHRPVKAASANSAQSLGLVAPAASALTYVIPQTALAQAVPSAAARASAAEAVIPLEKLPMVAKVASQRKPAAAPTTSATPATAGEDTSGNSDPDPGF